MILCVIAIVGGIYYFQYWINLPENSNSFVILGFNFASIIASIMNAVVIVVCALLSTLCCAG